MATPSKNALLSLFNIPEINIKKEDVSRTVVADPHSINSTTSEVVRKGRRREPRRSDPTVQEARRLKIEGMPLYMIAIHMNLEHETIYRWDEKNWLNESNRRRKNQS